MYLCYSGHPGRLCVIINPSQAQQRQHRDTQNTTPIAMLISKKNYVQELRAEIAKVVHLSILINSSQIMSKESR